MITHVLTVGEEFNVLVNVVNHIKSKHTKNTPMINPYMKNVFMITMIMIKMRFHMNHPKKIKEKSGAMYSPALMNA